MTAVLKLLAWLFANLGLSFSAWAWARTAFPSSRRSYRIVEVATLHLWSVLAIGLVTCLLGAFRVEVVLAAGLAAALVALRFARRVPGFLDLATAMRSLPALLRNALARQERLLLVLALLPFGVYLLRSVGAPPRAWDALTYHLLKAGRWVQSGGFHYEPAPGAWSYYAFFPPGGDLLWAWAMLPVHGDGLLFIAYLGIHLGLGLVAYALAVQLGAPRAEALLVTTFAWMIPAVVHFATSAYVDSTFLLFVLAGTFFAARAARDEVPFAALLWGALAMGGAATTKPTGNLTLAAFGAFGLVLIVQKRIRRSALALALLPSGLFLIPMAWAWWHTGSWTYPFELKIGGRVLSSGNPLLLRTLECALMRRGFGEWDYLQMQFWGSFEEGWAHLNLGVGSLAVLGAGIIALGMNIRKPGGRAIWLLVFALALIPVAGSYSSTMAAQRWYWAPVAGRFLTPTVVLFAVAIAAVAARGSKWPGAVLLLATLAQAAQAAPCGVLVKELAWAFGPAACFLAVPVVGALAQRLSRRFGDAPAFGAGLAAAALTFAVAAPTSEHLRATHRYDYEAISQDGRAFDVHPIAGLMDTWTAWEWLDQDHPLRIAFSAGDEGIGQRWYQYPLLGSELQNTVIYVSPARDGKPLEARNRKQVLQNALDRDAYYSRLVDRGVDYVVLSWPPPPETELVLSDPDRFEVAYATNLGTALVLRVRPNRLRNQAIAAHESAFRSQ